MKKIMILSMMILTLAVVSFGEVGYAAEYSYAGSYALPENQDGFLAEEYEMRAGRKLTRGTKNFLLGWLEIPHGVKSEIGYREQEYLPVGMETFFIGTFKGIGKTFGRMGVGLYEIFTFPYAQGPVIEEMDEWLY